MKIGLMLGGGGAKGSYQIGVLEVLEKYRLLDQVSIISGASIGAINGYFYLGSNLEGLKASWLYGIKNNPIGKKVNIRGGGLWSIEVLKEIASKYIEEEKFKNSEQLLYIISTEIKSPSLKSYLFKSQWEEKITLLNEVENPVDYVISSASIPVVFGAKEIKEKYYIDGGLINNNPLDILIKEGCELVFAVPLEKPINYQKQESANVTVVELTDLNIFPKGIGQLLSIVDFDLLEMENRIEYAKYTTEEMLKECLKRGILKFENGNYHVSSLKEGLNVITLPAYVKATLQNMIYLNYQKRKEKADGNN